MLVKHLVQVVLVGALAAGTLAFATGDNHVTVIVDGSVTHVSSRADTVGELLAERGLVISTRDAVSPGLVTALRDGETVRVNRARLVVASVDGKVVQTWTTATTVAQALTALGVQSSGASVSKPLTDAVPLGGLAVSVRLPYRVTIVHDLQRTTLSTTARTVTQALRAADVNLGTRDQVGAPSPRLVDGSVITVTRVGVGTVKVSYAVSRKVIKRKDPGLFVGVSHIVTRGRDARGVAQYRVTRHDGVIVKRTLLDRSIVRRGRPRIVRIGTKPRPTPTVPGASGLNWAALAQCESGGNPGSVNAAGYYGLYQFSVSTWASVGGSGNPIDASPAEQTYRAQLLYQRSGASPWPVCGSLLFT